MVQKNKIRYCACCGNALRLHYSCNEICIACGWEDDELQNDDPSFDGGANDMSLAQAKEAYKNGLPIK